MRGRLDDQQIDEVIAYIGSLPEGPRNFGPGATDTGMTHGGMMDGMDGGMMSGWMWLVPVLVLGAIAAAVGALGYVLARRRSGGTEETPRDILDRRYASGELTRDEYLQLRDDLDER